MCPTGRRLGSRLGSVSDLTVASVRVRRSRTICAVEVRAASEDDWPGIWPIWHAVVAAGDSYVWSPSTGYDEARRLWMLPSPAEVVVVEETAAGGVAVSGEHLRFLATAVLKPNQPGLGSHVANASFMVHPACRGRGVGRSLGESVLERARAAGYQAMQFNAVVSTNDAAIGLWRSLAFDVVGRIPGGFRPATGGSPVDLLIMHRRL